jgi:proteasome lid subunit RPN8/RPN11
MGNGALIEVRNVAENPDKGFKMDSHQMVQKLKETDSSIAGVWHTHPSGTLTPSPEDIRAITIGAIGPEWLYVIATANDVSVYYASHYAPLDQKGWSKFAR